MPQQVFGYRVFFGSPGGLNDERTRFREIVSEYNETDALENGVLFMPIGWELTLRGMGRPQKLINEDLRRSDYCVFLLHDRWGSPTSESGQFSSGTEEEYLLARELFRAGNMLDLLVFFKAIEPSRLSDPGPQLQKVLNFKRQLEEAKELLFDTYSEIDYFEKAMRKHLSAWTRNHLKQQPTK
ncbi:MAG: DUF4062 domain-containing protein [Bryobacteraceae bacterium]